MEALGKYYDGKLDGLRKENVIKTQEIIDLKAKLGDTTRNLANTNLLLIEEKGQNITLMSRIRNMADDQNRLVIAFVVRDEILQKRFGVMLPNPFGESDNNPQSSIQQ